MTKYVFGVDVGGTTVKLGLFDAEGVLLKKWEIPTRKEDSGKWILPDVADSIQALMSEVGILKQEVLGMGICTPGGVDEKGTVYGAGNLGWGIFNIPQVLEELLDMPVKAANDANVAAYGEMLLGGGKGHKNVVMVTLGTGVGGGIIGSGKILTGATGTAGEIGHIHVRDDETEVCGCGCRGCLEQYASATGIARLAKRRLEASNQPSVLRDLDIVTAKDVFDAVKAQDELAIEIAQDFGTYLGKGLATIATMANPEVILIGGGVSKAGEMLFDFIRPTYERYTFPAIQKTPFKLATLGNDAGIYGAAGLIVGETQLLG